MLYMFVHILRSVFHNSTQNYYYDTNMCSDTNRYK